MVVKEILVVRTYSWPLFFLSPSPFSGPLWYISPIYRDKTPDEIHQEFNITEPFSVEVEKEPRDRNKWSTEPPIGCGDRTG